MKRQWDVPLQQLTPPMPYSPAMDVPLQQLTPPMPPAMDVPLQQLTPPMPPAMDVPLQQLTPPVAPFMPYSPAMEHFIRMERVRLSRRYTDTNERCYETVVNIFEQLSDDNGVDLFYRNLIPLAARYLCQYPPPVFTDNEVLSNEDTEEKIYRSRTISFLEDFNTNGHVLCPHVMDEKNEDWDITDNDVYVEWTVSMSDLLDTPFEKPFYPDARGLYDALRVIERQRLDESESSDGTPAEFKWRDPFPFTYTPLTKKERRKIVSVEMKTLDRRMFSEQLDYYHGWRTFHPGVELPRLYYEDDD